MTCFLHALSGVSPHRMNRNICAATETLDVRKRLSGFLCEKILMNLCVIYFSLVQEKDLVLEGLVSDLGVKVLDMTIEESRKDCHQRFLPRESNSKNHEVTLQPGIDDERPTGRIHGTKELAVLDDAE